jgi:tetratricopeptide (TPR) repeat protein
LARGLSLRTTKGFAAAEAGQAYSRAHELAEQRGETRQLFMAVFGLWVSANGRGGMVECRKISLRLQQLTAAEADDGLRLQAHHSAWTTCLFSGEPAAAHEHCEAGRRLYDPERHRPHRQLYGGHDPGACARYMGAQAHWLLGHPDTGLAIGREALEFAERIAHPFTLVTALIMNAVLHLDRDEPEMALKRIEAAEALAAEQRIGMVLEPQILRGAVMTAQGAFKEAVPYLRDGLGQPRAIRLRHYGLARLAEALSAQGEHKEALVMLRRDWSTKNKAASAAGSRSFIGSKASR